MGNLLKGLVVLAAVGFILAVIASELPSGDLLGVSAEAFSRACTNLALIAIALRLCFKEETATRG